MAVRKELCGELLRRLVPVYAGAMLFAVGLRYSELYWLGHLGVVEQRMSGAGTASVMLAVWLLLNGYTWWRLRSPQQLSPGMSPVLFNERLATRLLTLPYELLVGLTLLTTLSSLGVRAGQLAREHGGWSDWRQEVVLEKLQLILGESGLGLTVSVVLYLLLRRVLRSFILRLEPLQLGGGGSIIGPLIIAYAGTFLVAMMNLLQFVIASDHRGQGVNSIAFAVSFLFYFLFGITVLSMIAMEFRRDLSAMIRSIRELVSGHRERGPLMDKIPVISRDEAGELAMAFNELREKVGHEYEELEKELKLAYNIQQQLLPPGDIIAGACRIFSWSRSEREVGGDLCDVVRLDETRTAIAIGDVSGKGMPAALVMSAAIVLFRSEIKRGGSSSEVLQRINRQLCEALGGESYVSLGIGLVDTLQGTITYASAGHLSPYFIAAGERPIQIEGSSLPIGFDPEGCYTDVQLELKPGDRFVLITDGMVELRDRQGELYGFERFESELASWEPGVPLAQLVEGMLKKMEAFASGLGQDDRTIVVLEMQSPEGMPATAANVTLAGGGQLICQWLIPAAHGSERQVLQEMERLIGENWPQTSRLEDMKSAVAEAVINAAEHGNRLNESRQIRVKLQIGTHLIVCRVYDQGAGFDAAEAKRRELYNTDRSQQEDPRGWGLMLIDGLTDYWETGRDKEGFYVELFFLRKAERSWEKE